MPSKISEALQPLCHKLTPRVCKLPVAHLHQTSLTSGHSGTSPQGKWELARHQGPGRGTGTESAVCRCLLSTGGCGSSLLSLPGACWQGTRCMAHAGMRPHTAQQRPGISSPLSKAKFRPSVEGFLQIIYLPFGKGRGLSLVVYIVSGISAVLLTSVPKLFPLGSPLVLKNQCEAPVNESTL